MRSIRASRTCPSSRKAATTACGSSATLRAPTRTPESIPRRIPATLVFQGPHAYVSASWYEEPYKTVPTWNYTAVHVYGRLHEFDAWEAVKLLTEGIEGDAAGAWDPDRLAPEYRDRQLAAIVGFKLRADAIYAKAKLSQNRTGTDRLRVIDVSPRRRNKPIAKPRAPWPTSSISSGASPERRSSRPRPSRRRPDASAAPHSTSSRSACCTPA